jgi:hypothetical protein
MAYDPKQDHDVDRDREHDETKSGDKTIASAKGMALASTSLTALRRCSTTSICRALLAVR